MKKITIAGGTGLIGGLLSRALRERGYLVQHLSRTPGECPEYATYKWDPSRGDIDLKALLDLDGLINLAGAGIADRPWTKSRRRVLYESRVAGNRLLRDAVAKVQSRPNVFIGSSAVGYYGDQGDREVTEDTPPMHHGFLGELSRDWEASQDAFADLDVRMAKLRIGLVLSGRGGVLPVLRRSIVFGVGACLGTGAQYMSWIHETDMVQMIIRILEDDALQGVYNAVSPNPVQHETFMRLLVRQKGGLGWLPKVPAPLLRLLMGERSALVLDSSRVIPQRMLRAGFTFTFPKLKAAVQDLEGK